MNCKSGDLAVVVRGIPAENIGRVITVTAAIDWFGTICWFYDGHLVGHDGGHCPCIADDCLRPLRPDEGDDETLASAGKPATHDAPVTA